MADDETQVFSKSQLSCIAPANVIVRRNTFNGDLPEIKRLVATVPGLDVGSITADHEQSTDARLVFVLVGSQVCTECGGSGDVVSHHPT